MLVDGSYCHDCEACISLDDGKDYMVTHDLWLEYAHDVQEVDGMLCPSCLEVRLGRSLEDEDFLDCLSTDWFFEAKVLEEF